MKDIEKQISDRLDQLLKWECIYHKKIYDDVKLLAKEMTRIPSVGPVDADLNGILMVYDDGDDCFDIDFNPIEGEDGYTITMYEHFDGVDDEIEDTFKFENIISRYTEYQNKVDDKQANEEPNGN